MSQEPATAGPAARVPESVNVAGLRVALFAQSVAFGLILGVQGVIWVEVLTKLSLSEGVFGSAQLALPLIGVVVLVFNAQIYGALGARNQSMVSLALLLAGMVSIGLIQSLLGLVLGLLLCGLGFAGLDAATNAAAIDLESVTEKHYLSYMHGFQAASALLGALVAAGGLAAGWTYPQVVVVASLVVCLPVIALTALVKFVGTGADAEAPPDVPASLWRNRQFVSLVVLCFAGSAAEAIAVVWAVIYLRGEGLSIGVAGIAFAAFNGAMIVGRFANGWLVRSRGVRVSLWLSGIGMLVAGGFLLSAGTAAIAVIGVVLLGLAVAGVQPSTISAAGRLGENSGATASGVMLAAYFALLVAPFAYGWLADWSTLQVATILVVLCGVAGTALVFGLPADRKVAEQVA